jgi:hypothetical protein
VYETESARSLAYYVTKLYAVSKSLAKARLTLLPSGNMLQFLFHAQSPPVIALV